MKYFILTDIEGAAGVDSFSQTRTHDETAKGAAMSQLAREVNACIEGIHTLHPDAEVAVWDGHGTGGLRSQDIVGGTYLREGKPYYQLEGFEAMLFVGQHAMAGTAFAPLAHTYSSKSIAYYRLNGVFIGEFGARALVAGEQGVPTIFLAGDDKAALEAKMFIPAIETVSVKTGEGLEAAVHDASAEACRKVREGTVRALQRAAEIRPFTGIRPPYTLEIRYLDPANPSRWQGEHVTWLDERTVQIRAERLADLPF